MGKKIKILYLSSEIAPFAKTGGLADVAGTLPKVLAETEHDIKVMMPKYGTIDDKKFKLQDVPKLKEIIVPFADQIKIADVKSTFLPDSKAHVYLIENKHYYDRPELYRDPDTNKDWVDNAERFAFFCRACLEVVKILQWRPDIIHCNDWQTSLIPLFLKNFYKGDPFFQKIATLLTIHNIAYQGLFEKEVLKLIGIPEELFYPGSAVEYWGKTNFLKIGIVYSDLINTVSEAYALEIQQNEEYGYGLEGVLRDRKKYLYGIVNGIDYSVWNPEIDELIVARYSWKDLKGKMLNKQSLIKANNLSFDRSIPLIGAISRLVDQKGFDLIEEIFTEMMKLDLQFVLLGTGDEKYHKLFKKLCQKYPKKMGINLTFNNPLAHLIEAGSDMFLMPSKYEPCGLNQLYSLKYGTIPIVRATGGLKDTIEDFNLHTATGTGFIFQEYSGKALLNAIKRALEVFKNKTVWKKLIQNAMKMDFSWGTSAHKYLTLYQKCRK